MNDAMPAEKSAYIVRFRHGDKVTSVPVRAAADAHEAVQEARLVVGPDWQLWEAYPPRAVTRS